MTVRWLIDKSALWRANRPDVNDVLQPRIARGLVGVSIATELEVGFSARSGADLRHAASRPPYASMPVEYLTPVIEDRAVEVQMLLADRGLRRGVSIPDVLVAATAESGRLVVVHVDRYFDLIAGVTGLPVELLRME